MTETRIERAEAVVARLLAQAVELDWAGEHARADALRRRAAAIKARGQDWVTHF